MTAATEGVPDAIGAVYRAESRRVFATLRAIALAGQEPERRFLERRLADLPVPPTRLPTFFVVEAEDFGAEFTPELKAQQERLRATVAARK